MVNLVLKNLKEIPSDFERDLVEKQAEKLRAYLDKRFAKYSKNLELEIIVNKSAATTLISASLDLKSKKVVMAEEDKIPVKAATTLFDKFKKAVIRQYEHEKKEYEYKRKR